MKAQKTPQTTPIMLGSKKKPSTYKRVFNKLMQSDSQASPNSVLRRSSKK